jgi:hypothetical protein
VNKLRVNNISINKKPPLNQSCLLVIIN